MSRWRVLSASRVILGEAAWLVMRRNLDARIAARLAAGWVPVDAGLPGTTAVPLPPAVAQQLRHPGRPLTPMTEPLPVVLPRAARLRGL